MQAELRDSLEFLFPDSTVSGRTAGTMTLDVARGGTVAVHVLVSGLKKGAAVRFGVSPGAAVRAARWFRLIDVPVEENTGLKGFTERTHKRNRFVIRRAPFRVFDAMQPVRASIKAPAATMVLRLHLPVAADDRPGMRRLRVTIQSGGQEVALLLAARVHPAVIPPVGAESWQYTNWFSYENIAERHGLKPWSPAYWRMLRRYANLMASSRQNMFWVPLAEVFTQTKAGPVLNRSRLRRIVSTFTAAGLYWIEGGQFAHGTGPVLQGESFNVFGDLPAAAPEGHAALASMAGQLMAEIDRNGWRERWLQHAADEPGGPNARDYRILVGMIHKYMPGIPVCEALLDTALCGSVDIWCPVTHFYAKGRAAYESQRRFGDRIWTYTCCTPGGRWLNRLLDMELLRPALLGWASARYRLDGFLHWGLNHYGPGQDPFRRSVPRVKFAGKALLPAGDTHVVYPGDGGPWSSVRLESQREGIEDLELLRRLQARAPKAADAIIRRVVRSFRDYTTDIETFRAARRALFQKVR